MNKINLTMDQKVRGSNPFGRANFIQLLGVLHLSTNSSECGLAG